MYLPFPTPSVLVSTTCRMVSILSSPLPSHIAPSGSCILSSVPHPLPFSFVDVFISHFLTPPLVVLTPHLQVPTNFLLIITPSPLIPTFLFSVSTHVYSHLLPSPARVLVRRNLTENTVLNTLLKRSALRSLRIPLAFP